MTQTPTRRTGLLIVLITLLLAQVGIASGGVPVAVASSTIHPSTGHPSFLSPHARPIAAADSFIYVVNTPADSVDVIDRTTKTIIQRIPVGIDPVSLAIRPDGLELWVSNHISDTVSVVDLDKSSPAYHHVVATIQQLNGRTKATQFDEPVGIAFAGNNKAYVALSSENLIAVIDVKQRRVVRRISIPAQDPRAIVVRDEKLYVIPFESNNQTQLSGGNQIDGDLVTFNAWDHSIRVNNVLSLGHVVDIVKNPAVPDKDLFIFDTRTDKLISTVDSLGTLLYGLDVDSRGRVFIAQADARNDANGLSGTQKHGLEELENRAFLNQITRVDTADQSSTTRLDLEPLPPEHPDREKALATPFAVRLNVDESVLFATAAGSNQLFAMNPDNGDIIGRVTVNAVPRGIALPEVTANHPSQQAWVLNAVANTVSVVNVTDPSNMSVTSTITLEDPTHPVFKRGRTAFNDALASSTGTFSCASCHPDGHTDQLLWILKTPIVTAGNQIMPRSTMPIRGLRDTAPYHWDGIPGDPFGGNNSEHIYGLVEPNALKDVPSSTTRHLIDASLASTMLQTGDETTNDADQTGYLSHNERDDLSRFLLGVSYPPAQRRAFDNTLSARAKKGMELFNITGDVGGTPGGNFCGDCHRMPFLVSTNTPGSGMDAPTWRGAYDRWLILPQGRLNIIDFDFFADVAKDGLDEQRIWQFSWGGRPAFDPVWNMVLESSTGYSGSLGRQVTLNSLAPDKIHTSLIDALEKSAAEGAVVLIATGVDLTNGKSRSFLFKDGQYKETGNSTAMSRDQLIQHSRDGKMVVTLTGHHGVEDDIRTPQPGLWTLGPMHAQRGRQLFPVIHGDDLTMSLMGRNLSDEVHLIVDGRRVEGSIEKYTNERIKVTLANLPQEGLRFLQLQNRDGLFTNDFIFHVAEDRDHAIALQNRLDPERERAIRDAIQRGDVVTIARLFDEGAPLLSAFSSDGSMPLVLAAMYGEDAIVEYLINIGANVNTPNRDGNTALHLAAFMCHPTVVQRLLDHGAPIDARSTSGDTPADTVRETWSQGLAGFYSNLINGGHFKQELAVIQERRPKILKLLTQYERQHARRDSRRPPPLAMQ